MLSINANPSFGANQYAGYSDIGVEGMLAFQTAHEAFLQTVSASSNIDYGDGAFLNYRGVQFAGYLAPYPEIINLDKRLQTYTDINGRRMQHNLGTGSHTCNIRTNFLLNRKTFAGITIGKEINFGLRTYYQSGQVAASVTTVRLDVAIKKVNSVGTITVLKTIPQKTLSNEGGANTTYRDIFVEDTANIASLNSDDVLYIETILSYVAVTTSADIGFGLVNNGGRMAYLSIT